MKRAIIFYNGDLADLTNAKSYIKPSDYIICADGGAEHALRLGVKPHVILGDFDSLSKMSQEKCAQEHIPFITYQREKDETDSELAVLHALKKGYKKILLFGVLGSQFDHMLTNIFALDYFTRLGADVTIIEGKQEMRLMQKHIKLVGKKNDLLSLIPFKGNARNIVTKNLYYPLKGEDLLFGYSRGIRNVFTADTVEISIEEGSLLVIHYRG